jgi:hypothetical protein
MLARAFPSTAPRIDPSYHPDLNLSLGAINSSGAEGLCPPTTLPPRPQPKLHHLLSLSSQRDYVHCDFGCHISVNQNTKETKILSSSSF